MIITHGNTVLRSLAQGDLEMIRRWRNDPSVNKHLLNREFISKEAQLKWFRNINPNRTLYLVAEEKGIPFGLIYATDIDREERSYWGNILIGESEYRDSYLPVKAVVMLMWCFFHELSFEVCYSKVASENAPAVKLNMAMGFRHVSETDAIRTERCSKDDFIKDGVRLTDMVLRGILPTMEDMEEPSDMNVVVGTYQSANDIPGRFKK
jgi:RimJ/RimL family protein N-acetyltransferase